VSLTPKLSPLQWNRSVL